jgi:hypothetical protein
MHFWYRNLQMEQEENSKTFYEELTGNLKSGRWMVNFGMNYKKKKENWPGYIWQEKMEM